MTILISSLIAIALIIYFQLKKDEPLEYKDFNLNLLGIKIESILVIIIWLIYTILTAIF